jgi:hypothetical protein
VSPLPKNTNPDSVAWITASARRALDDQDRRAESLQTRAAQIAGFSGAVVALAAPLGLKELGHAAGTAKALAGVMFFLGVTALALTILAAIIFVLKPVPHRAIASKEVRNYVQDPRFLTQSPQEIEFRTLKAMRTALERHEVVNARKAQWLTASSYSFLTGLAGIVGTVVTLSID